MSKNLRLGLPSLGISVAKKITDKPALFLKDDAMYLNNAAMRALNIKFTVGQRSKIAILAVSNDNDIIIVNGDTTDVPNMVKSSIYKNGKINHSKFQSTLAGILEVNDEVEDKDSIILIQNKVHPQVLTLDLNLND